MGREKGPVVEVQYFNITREVDGGKDLEEYVTRNTCRDFDYRLGGVLASCRLPCLCSSSQLPDITT